MNEPMVGKPGFCNLQFAPVDLDAERRADGIVVLRSRHPPSPQARCIGERLERWAAERPDIVFLAQRDAARGWRTLTYADARTRVRSLAAALLARGLSAERPVAILSDNSIEHALLMLACLHAGVPVAPISPAYSLMSNDFAKLKGIFDLIRPGLVFAEDGARFGAAVNALKDFDFEIVTLREPPSGLLRRMNHSRFGDLAQTTAGVKVERAFASIGPDTIGKLLFTSGSTGEPKAVINTQRMLCFHQQGVVKVWPFLETEAHTLVDWLPWNHTAGGNNDFGLTLWNGATLYIDEGKPAPGLIERTVANLREVSATIHFNVPRGLDMLLPHLESDAPLRRNFFRRLKVICYAGAALPASLWERIERLSVQERGERVRILSGLGATETSPGVTMVHWDLERPGNVGLPVPGVALKMVPMTGQDDRNYELRVRGPNVMPGYWRRPDLTRAAFDEEGFYRMGDAARFADASEPAKGIEFGGRLAEEFKLASGTWVQVSALRVRAIAALTPLAQDIVICGHERDEIGFLVFPSIPGCRSLAPDVVTDAPHRELLGDARVRSKLAEGLERLKREGGGTSTYATRALFLEDPPSIDAGEITDKGYLNQSEILARRADKVARLYSNARVADPDVIALQ